MAYRDLDGLDQKLLDYAAATGLHYAEVSGGAGVMSLRATSNFKKRDPHWEVWEYNDQGEWIVIR